MQTLFIHAAEIPLMIWLFTTACFSYLIMMPLQSTGVKIAVKNYSTFCTTKGGNLAAGKKTFNRNHQTSMPLKNLKPVYTYLFNRQWIRWHVVYTSFVRSAKRHVCLQRALFDTSTTLATKTTVLHARLPLTIKAFRRQGVMRTTFAPVAGGI